VTIDVALTPRQFVELAAETVRAEFHTITRLTLEDVLVQGGDSGPVLYVLFRVEGRPDCLFGFNWGDLWEMAHDPLLEEEGHDRAGAHDAASVVLANVEETVYADDMGLPETCVEHGVTWITNPPRA
jgi:hypothetical protein